MLRRRPQPGDAPPSREERLRACVACAFAWEDAKDERLRGQAKCHFITLLDESRADLEFEHVVAECLRLRPRPRRGCAVS